MKDYFYVFKIMKVKVNMEKNHLSLSNAKSTTKVSICNENTSSSSKENILGVIIGIS